MKHIDEEEAFETKIQFLLGYNVNILLQNNGETKSSEHLVCKF